MSVDKTSLVTCVMLYESTGEGIARGDAERVLKALKQRWPQTTSFEVESQGPGVYAVVVDNAHFHERFRGFAEGFYASAHLWER